MMRPQWGEASAITPCSRIAFNATESCPAPNNAYSPYRLISPGEM